MESPALGKHVHSLSGAASHVVAVKLGNVIHGDTLRAGSFALELVGAIV